MPKIYIECRFCGLTIRPTIIPEKAYCQLHDTVEKRQVAYKRPSDKYNNIKYYGYGYDRRKHNGEDKRFHIDIDKKATSGSQKHPYVKEDDNELTEKEYRDGR